MKGLAELVVSLCDLCEAEGRLLQEGVLRTVRRTVTLTLGLLFGAAALALLLAALYALLTSFMPVPAGRAHQGAARPPPARGRARGRGPRGRGRVGG